MKAKLTLEVACTNMESVQAAIRGGADRIELCAALSVGGITPSDAFIQQVLEVSSVPVFVMIRPREGDFLYSSVEFEIMLREVERCSMLGVPGIVTGLLNADGTVDVLRTKRLVQAAGTMAVTFHRAFDLSTDLSRSLEAIIETGCNRLLTSGMSSSALSGVACIRELVRLADGRIEIMAGAGISSENVSSIIRDTGVREVHLSGKRIADSPMSFRRPELSMGIPGADEYSLTITDEFVIRAIRTCLDSIA